MEKKMEDDVVRLCGRYPKEEGHTGSGRFGFSGLRFWGDSSGFRLAIWGP